MSDNTQDFIFISVPTQYEIIREAAYKLQLSVPEFIVLAVHDKLESIKQNLQKNNQEENGER